MSAKMPSLVLLLSGLALGQTDIYAPYKNADLWDATPLYVGGSFIRTAPGPIIVSLKGNEAGWRGRLYAINPAAGDTVYLFDNFSPRGTSVDLGAMTVIPIGTTVYFMYRVVDMGFARARDREPKFTGPNLRGDRYFSPVNSDSHPNVNWRYGHRWSVVGRLPTGVLEFGFEDNTNDNSDMDFDDVVFQVTGLSLGIFTRDLDRKSLVW